MHWSSQILEFDMSQQGKLLNYLLVLFQFKYLQKQYRICLILDCGLIQSLYKFSHIIHFIWNSYLLLQHLLLDRFLERIEKVRFKNLNMVHAFWYQLLFIHIVLQCLTIIFIQSFSFVSFDHSLCFISYMLHLHPVMWLQIISLLLILRYHSL